MKILRSHLKNPKVSIILLDWGVRESFHTLDYLDRQNVSRSEYEVIWVEFFDRAPQRLLAKVEDAERAGRPLIEQWIVLEAGPEIYFHKHYAYNVGIVLARGQICVVCDSDAMYPPDFVERIIAAFSGTTDLIVHLDQIRNANPAFYPFNYPDPDQVVADSMTINWTGKTTRGLAGGADMLHEANYGACLAARRSDLIAIGGADEHSDYLGYICGPYDMTFRLVNFGRREIWLDDIFLIHTWHPSEGGSDNLGGPNDGRGMSLRALEARSSGRCQPLVENPAIRALRLNPTASQSDLISSLASVDFGRWHRDTPHLEQLSPPVLVRENIGDYNIIRFRNQFYAFPQSEGAFLPERVVSGAYDAYPREASLEQLLARLTKPLLRCGTLAGFDILQFEGKFYAWPFFRGAFLPERAAASEYSGLLQGENREGLERSIRALRREERDRIAESGLFDADYYLRSNADVAAAGADPLSHFVENGALEGRKPNPFFDPAWYLAANPSVAAIGLNPLAHFVAGGAAGGSAPHWLFDTSYYVSRNADAVAPGANPLSHFLRSAAPENQPHPLFDPAFYLCQNADVAASGAHPWIHFVEQGAAEGRQPHPLFDPAFYLRQSSEFPEARENPLRHFLEVGASRGLNPHPLFDTRYYMNTYPDAALSGANPLAHFLELGAAKGYKPCALFDTAYYLAESPAAAASGMNPLIYFLQHGAFDGANPGPLFHTGYYLVHNPEVAEAGVNPLAHFREDGGREGRNPNPLFDSAWYLARNPDVAAAGVNPLEHFLTCGALEGRMPNWLFDPDYYLTRYPDIAADGVNPLTHYLLFGAAEDRHPHPLFDPTAYKERNPDVATARVNPLIHFLEHGIDEGRQPCILFDASFYLQQCPRDILGRDNPLRHFIETGAARQLNPHPLFDTKFYASQGSLPPDRDPLTHYVAVGGALGRSPHRLFDAAFYLRKNPDVGAGDLNPLEHFLRYGAREGRWPNPLFNIDQYLLYHPEVASNGMNPLVHFVLSTPDQMALEPQHQALKSRFTRRGLAPLSVIISTHDGSQVLTETLEACRRCSTDCGAIEFIVIDSGCSTASNAVEGWAAQMPTLSWKFAAGKSAATARNLAIAAARFNVLLFLSDDLLPADENFFRVHAALHAAFPEKNFAVRGNELWPVEPVGSPPLNINHVAAAGSFEHTELPARGFIHHRYFRAANLSFKKSALRDWPRDGFRADIVLDDLELGYRLSSREGGLKLLYDPQAVARHSETRTLASLMKSQVGTGEALASLIRLHPDMARDFGVERIVANSSSPNSELLYGLNGDYDLVIEGVKAWVQMLALSPHFRSESWADDLIVASFELCQLQGLLQRSDSGMSKSLIFEAFVRRVRQLLHHKFVGRFSPLPGVGLGLLQIRGQVDASTHSMVEPMDNSSR